MNKPEMILFDWGGTLAYGGFDGISGTQAVLDAAKNSNGCTAKQIQEFADTMNKEFGRLYGYGTDEPLTEVHQYPFQRFLYEYFGVELGMSMVQAEEIFWTAANRISNTDGIEDFLRFLKTEGIRTAVISNISFSEQALCSRINSYLPDNDFEFIIASSEYVYRKPSPRIFELALRKAGTTADKAWYCGDNVYCDVAGSANAGLTPVWYKGALYGEQPSPTADCIEVSSWKELQGIITSLSHDEIRV